MAKNADIGNFWQFFAIFKPFTGIMKLFFSCRGVSKLRFGWSYVKIS